MNRLKSIGERLATTRAGMGLSVEEVAHALQVAPGVIKGWESGSRRLQADRVLDFAAMYGVSCDYLMAGVASVPVAMVQALQKAAGNHSSQDQ